MENYLKHYDLKCQDGWWVVVDYLGNVTKTGFDSYESARDWLVANSRNELCS